MADNIAKNQIELRTRIALKYSDITEWTNDTYEGQGANLVLLPGELGICVYPAESETEKDVVVFKVGDGTHTFEELPWCSAKASDVYSWAKASNVILEDKKLKFIFNITTEAGTTTETIKEIAFNYVTEADVKAITDPIAKRVTDIENAIGLPEDATDSIATQLGALDGRLDIIEGENTGSIKKALKEAKDHTDAEVLKDRNRISSLETAKADHEDRILTNTQAISDEATARANADTAINEKLGGSFTKDATVAGTIAGLSTRLAEIEAFFAGAAKDETIEGELKNALDTLVEIQTYINSDGEIAEELLDAVTSLSEIINGIEADESAGIVGKAGIVDTIASHTEDLATLKPAVNALKDIVDGYSTKGSVKAALDLAKEQADKGVNDAKLAKDAADAAQRDLDILEEIVTHETTGLAATKQIADDNTKAIGNINTDITNLKATVDTGDDANAKLRASINLLQQLTGDASKGNEQLRSDITSATTRIAAIEGDYLRAADTFILNCGSATKYIAPPPAITE